MISSQISNEKNINYGLDHLSIEIQSKKSKESKMMDLEKNSNIPESNLLKKLAKFSNKDFYFRWSLIILVCNIYNTFSVPYFLALARFPSKSWLVFELFAECILLCDLLGRVFLSKTMKFTSFWHLNESLGIFYSLLLLFSSIPYTFFKYLILSDSYSVELTLINLCKLFRIFQIQQFLDKLEITLNLSRVFKESVKICLILVFTIHIFSCIWLFVNKFEENLGVQSWTESNSLLTKGEFEVYIEALLWGCENLTGLILENNVKYSDLEILICIFIMIASAIVSGIIYSKFIDLMDAINSPAVQTQEKLKQILEWGNQIQLPAETLFKIKIYYDVAQQRFNYLLNYDFIPELPFALRTELNLNIFKDLIENVKFFSLGDPSFIVAFMRHLKPRVYMKGDTIIKAGEYADEFFIVRYGTVEVLASDNSTQITLLDRGNFFGEIGVVFNQLRTVTVQAYTAVILCYICKEELMPILKEFPAYFNYLRNVAEQRKNCVDPEDIDENYDLLDESISSDESDLSDELERPKIFTEAEHGNKPWLMKFLTVAASNAPSDYLVIDPLSYFYYIWGGVLGICYIFFLLYIPFSIAFEVNGNNFVAVLNFLAYFVYLVDIFISINTAIMTEYKVYYHHKEEIVRNYIVNFLYSDLISLVPIDLIFMFIPSPQYVCAYLRIFRLFKYPRVKSVTKVILNEIPLIPKTLFSVFCVFFFVSHYLGCIVFYLAKFEDYYFSEQPFNDSGSEYEYNSLKSLTSQTLGNQYLSILYWTTGILSISGYRNLIPFTSFGKCLMILILIITYVLVLLLYAVSTKVSYMLNIHYANFIKKSQILELWMSNKKLSESNKKKLNDYYLLVWKKSSSFQTNYIIKDLPITLKKEILNYLFACVYESGLFTNHPAPLKELVNKCKVEYYCPEAVIVNQGDLVLEAYFLIEGTVNKVENDINIVMLYKGCYFCEQYLESEKFGCCESSFIAKNEVRLAVLKISDYREVVKKFPEFGINEFRHRNSLFDESFSYVYTDKDNTNQDKTPTSMNKVNSNLTEIYSNSIEYTSTGGQALSTKVKISNSFCFKIQEKLKFCLYFIVIIWNAFYGPYYMCMELKLSVFEIFFEVLTMIVYYTIFISDTIALIKVHKSAYLILSNLPVKVYYHFISGFPIILVSDQTYKSDFLILAFSIFRLLNIYLIPKYINKLTRYYVSWYKLLRLLLMLIFYLYSIHIFACLFILVGKQDPKYSWFSQLSSNSNKSKYIFATYWASSILSHTSFGDIQLNTNPEKTFAIFVFFLSLIIFSLIFGTVCSLILSFSPQLKLKIEKSFEYVKIYLKKKKVFKFFSKPVENFFNHLWNVNKGIDENEIFNELNKELRVLLQISIYKKAVNQSDVLKDPHGELNEALVRSIFALLRIEYYSIGESLIKIGDKSQNMFFLLEGMVDVLNLKGTKVLATLKPGAHFGEANFILNNDMRTASIMATEVCTVGILGKNELQIIFEAFPMFFKVLQGVVQERMIRTFNSSNLDVVNQQTQSVMNKITYAPGNVTRFTIRSEKLIAEKIAMFELKIMENQWYSLYLTHFIFLIYSGITLPLFIGYFFETNLLLICLEIGVITESTVFLWKNTNFNIFLPKNRQFGWIGLIKYYYNNHFFEDLAATSPFHLIYMATRQQNKAIMVLLSLIRLLALFRLQSLTEIVELHYRNSIKYMKLAKIIVKLSFYIHLVSCFWNFFTVIESPATWRDFHNLDSVIFSRTYLFSLYYSVNILTSKGHSNTHPFTDTEKILSSIISIVALGFFAVLCGYFASNNAKETPDILKMINKIKNSLNMSRQSEIPEYLKSRIKEFYSFSAYIDKKIGGIYFENLFEHLPTKLTNSIIFRCHRFLLKKLPILAQIDKNEVIEKLALHLEPQIFLTDDFVIYKNDVGNEMYFLLIGSVNILAQDNQKVLKTLRKGDFFGEMALVHDTNRMCSVIANKPSLIYSLKKEVFLAVIEDFPEILEKIKFEGEKRKSENTLVRNKESVYNNLQYEMYASISKSFFAKQQSCGIIHKLSGMKNFKPEVISNCLDNEKKSKIHTRRPHKGEYKKRLSQENLEIDFIKNF